MLCMVVLLFGCTTKAVSPDKPDALASLDVSAFPANVYVGISGPYSTQERMVSEAILAAAKSIHLKEALALDSRLVTSYHSGEGLKSFAKEEAAFYDDSSMAKTISQLEVLDIQFNPEAGAVVVVKNNQEEETKRIYESEYNQAGKPTWLNVYPKVDGYRFGVGSAKRHYFLNNSLEAADFSAAQNLLDLKTEHAYSVENVTTKNELMERSLYQAQRGLLKGFTIIARYYEKETDTYWSLAACLE